MYILRGMAHFLRHGHVTVNEYRDHSAQKSDSELCIPWDGACIALHNSAGRGEGARQRLVR